MSNMNWYDQETRRTRRPRRIEQVDSAEIGFPIAWVLIGALSAMLIIGLIGLASLNFLRRQSITPTPPSIPNLAPTLPVLETDTGNSTPTIPPVVTLPPTLTPVPSPTAPPAPPDRLERNGYAKIIGTDGFGASLRAGPGTNNARIGIVPEGSVVELKDGPRNSELPTEEYIWWLVQSPDGTEGWVATDFLQPSVAPRRRE